MLWGIRAGTFFNHENTCKLSWIYLSATVNFDVKRLKNFLFQLFEAQSKKRMVYWNGPAKTGSQKNTGSLEFLNQLFVVLARLTLDLFTQDIADRVGVSFGTLSTYFATWPGFVTYTKSSRYWIHSHLEKVWILPCLEFFRKSILLSV